MNRDYGGVIPPRGDDQPRSRNALSDAYCENYWPLQGRRRAGSAASKPSTHLPQIDRLMRTVRRGKRNVNCSNESSAVRALVPAVAQLAHDDRLRRRAERRRARMRSDMSRVWTMALWRIGKHREKFGRAEVKRSVAKSAPGCR